MTQLFDLEHKYLDALTVAGPSSKLAIYSQNFSETILEKASDYSLSIDRFRIPMDDIPIFKFDKSTNAYTVELEYNGVFSGRVPLSYIPTTINFTPNDDAYWSVWTFDIFIRMVNNALAIAFAQLGALVLLPVGSKQPFFTFENGLKTISVNAQNTIYDMTLAKPINVYLNQKLFVFFDGVPIKVVGQLYSPGVANGRDVQLLFFNTFSNIFTYDGSTYYKMISDNGFECISKWNMAKGFYLRSNNIPVRYEIMPSVSLDVNGNIIQNNNVDSQPIVCNFDFVYTPDSPKPLTAQYILNTPYKIIDMISQSNIKNLDLQVFWYDKYNNSYPLHLRPNDSMTIRLLFQKIPRV